MKPALPIMLPVHIVLVLGLLTSSYLTNTFLWTQPPIAVLSRKTANGRDAKFYLCRLVALILMSTPAGKLSLLSASMVFAVACMISMSRL